MRQSDWNNLMSGLGFKGNEDTYSSLKRRYGEKHRKYHTEAHIEAVLSELAKTRHLAKDYLSIELALWFHDAIYKSLSKTNEEDSADLAVSFISQNSGSNDLQKTVYSLVMATKHNFLPEKDDQRLIVDIDLTILGSSACRYEEFENAIRKEYKYVPWFIYKKERIKLLKHFLGRDTIYFNEYYVESFEKQARENITQAIDKLG